MSIKKQFAFRSLRVFSRHPSHNDLRKRKLMLPAFTLIRFGSQTVSKRKFDVEINSVDAIKISSNKFLMKSEFDNNQVKTSDWWYFHNDIWCFAKNNTFVKNEASIQLPIVAKHNFGSRGTGNYLLRTIEEYNTFIKHKDLSKYIFESFYNYDREYRLHVTEDGCFYTCRKMLKKDTPADKKWFRNDSNSVWVIENNPSFDKPTNWDTITSECVKALKAVGLDVGAVDLRVQSAVNSKGEARPNPDFIVIEINSAPSFGEVTLQKYIDEIPNIVKRKK